MSTSAPSKYSKTLSTLAAALSLVSLSAMAQERESAPLGIYGGGAFGVGAAQWECGTSCNRATFSGKFFGGKRLTPGLAAEVNYMFFGGLDRANDTATTASTGVAAVRQKMRALSVGINWEVELLNDFTNSLRVGWAFTRRDQNITYAGGATERVNDYGSAPYFGAGLSYQFARDMRLLSSFDYVVKGHESYYLFGIGGSMEF
ncbi:outer membrane beta-barrel protein [Aquabacterium sp.]|uniref:outer membrane beta-barrel protein n=1 Tax=Aquabacterium sp. TaxID=1872578 RepID=UPI0040384D3E